VPSGEGKAREANSKGYPIVKFFEEIGHYEGSARIKNGARDHRQVDTQDFVFTKQ
jgi:hypothetical protein